MDYNTSIDVLTNLKPHLDEIEKKTDVVESCLNQTKGLIENIDDAQAQSDVQSITESLLKLRKQLETIREEKSKEQETPEYWSLKRHDIRACVGGVKGYAELILDDIEGSHPELEKHLSYLIDIAEGLLSPIEKLRVAEAGEGFNDGNERATYEAPVHTGRILIVDDSPHKRELLSRRLVPVGHEILMAENGKQALEMLETETVDLILLDILMPGLSGYDVLMKLKENSHTRDIPVLVISSISELDSVVQCIHAGAEDYLPMPINPVLLHARVNACIDKKVLSDRDQEHLKQLTEARQRLDAAIESIDEGFAIFDANDRLTVRNTPFETMYPCAKKIPSIRFEEFLRTNIKEGIYQEERRNINQEKVFVQPGNPEAWIMSRLEWHRSPSKPYIERLASERWIEIIENKTPDGGTVCIHKDISDRISKEERLGFLANHDPLTGLANRALFDSSLKDIHKQAIEKKSSFAIMYFDLDGFKQVNDTLGHDFGDHLLKTVADNLRACLRAEDLLARQGGDEFAAILQNVGTQEDVSKLAERALEAVGTSVTRGDETANFGVSIGIALFPSDAENLTDLLGKADDAMYAAKRSGKGTYRFAA